jgi:MgtC family
MRWPDHSWADKICSVGDFNNDGKADILWQNNDGTPAIWLMNGTTPTTMVALGNPGPPGTRSGPARSTATEWPTLGAGVIMKEGKSVWGLNTAATLWCSAAVGAGAGADLAVEAIALTAFVLAGNTLLRPLVHAINRAPISAETTEAQYEVRLTTDVDHLENTREVLETELKAANYPIREVEVEDREAGTMELVATLASTDADPAELDSIVSRLKGTDGVQHVSWTARTAD